MAYTFFKARNLPVGTSLVENELLDAAREIDARAKARGLRFELPVDHVVAGKIDAAAATDTLAAGDPAIGERMGLDIGPKTIDTYRSVIAGAKTVVWNGPMGVFEIDAFAKGTMEIARAVAAVNGHDHHRRRRLDRGRREGRRHRQDHPHLNGRRRVARVSRRPGAAGRRGAARRVGFELQDAHSFHRGELEDVQDRPRGGRVHQGIPQAGRRPPRRGNRRRAAVHGAPARRRRRARVEHRRRRTERALGARRGVHGRGQRGDAEGSRRRATSSSATRSGGGCSAKPTRP